MMLLLFDKLKLFISILLLAGFMTIATIAYAYAPMVSMTVFDASLGVVLAEVARMGKANVVIDVESKETISVDFKNVPFETALYFIARAKGLSVEKKESNTYIVTSSEKMGKGFSQVQVMQLNYANAEAIKSSILGGEYAGFKITTEATGKKSSTEGKAAQAIADIMINTDPGTNSLIVFGTPEKIAVVRQLVQQLDVPYQQILLEAQVMSLNKSAMKNLGIDWKWADFPQVPKDSTTSTTTSTTVTSKDRVMPGAITFGGWANPEGILYELQYAAKISALVSNGEAKILARPNVLTLNGNKAQIFIGDDIPVVTEKTESSGKTTSTVEYKKAGILLEYIPQINSQNEITAAVHVEVATPILVAEMKNYRITSRMAKTSIRIKDGDTLVIGGLISSVEAGGKNKVPFLGDLPILGKLFQSVSKSKDETEVVIFLKAKIVK